MHAWVGDGERPEFVRQTTLIANIWTGLGADDLWTTDANWLDGTEPLPPEALTFTGNIQLSNTNDFAQTATSSHLHADLQRDFTTAGLKYFTSLRAALGHLRAAGEI